MANISIINGRVFINGQEVKQQQRDTVQDPNPEPKAFIYPDTPLLALDLSSAKVAIKRHAEPGVRVVVEGSQAFIDSVDIRERGDALVINESYSPPSSSFGSVVISGGMSIVNGVVSYGCDVGVITIEVPDNVGLELVNRGTGNVTVEPRLTSINATLKGTGNLKVGYCKGDAYVKSSGTGDVRINDGNVNGLIIIDSGTGDVYYGGSAGTIHVRNSGTGDVNLTGAVHDAKLRASGTGDIHVHKATGEVTKHNTGLGKIRVGK